MLLCLWLLFCRKANLHHSLKLVFQISKGFLSGPTFIQLYSSYHKLYGLENHWGKIIPSALYLHYYILLWMLCLGLMHSLFLHTQWFKHSQKLKFSFLFYVTRTLIFQTRKTKLLMASFLSGLSLRPDLLSSQLIIVLSRFSHLSCGTLHLLQRTFDLRFLILREKVYTILFLF